MLPSASVWNPFLLSFRSLPTNPLMVLDITPGNLSISRSTAADNAPKMRLRNFSDVINAIPARIAITKRPFLPKMELQTLWCSLFSSFPALIDSLILANPFAMAVSLSSCANRLRIASAEPLATLAARSLFALALAIFGPLDTRILEESPPIAAPPIVASEITSPIPSTSPSIPLAGPRRLLRPPIAFSNRPATLSASSASFLVIESPTVVNFTTSSSFPPTTYTRYTLLNLSLIPPTNLPTLPTAPPMPPITPPATPPRIPPTNFPPPANSLPIPDNAPFPRSPMPPRICPSPPTIPPIKVPSPLAALTNTFATPSTPLTTSPTAPWSALPAIPIACTNPSLMIGPTILAASTAILLILIGISSRLSPALKISSPALRSPLLIETAAFLIVVPILTTVSTTPVTASLSILIGAKIKLWSTFRGRLNMVLSLPPRPIYSLLFSPS